MGDALMVAELSPAHKVHASTKAALLTEDVIGATIARKPFDSIRREPSDEPMLTAWLDKLPVSSCISRLLGGWRRRLVVVLRDGHVRWFRDGGASLPCGELRLGPGSETCFEESRGILRLAGEQHVLELRATGGYFVDLAAWKSDIDKMLSSAETATKMSAILSSIERSEVCPANLESVDGPLCNLMTRSPSASGRILKVKPQEFPEGEACPRRDSEQHSCTTCSAVTIEATYLDSDSRSPCSSPGSSTELNSCFRVAQHSPTTDQGIQSLNGIVAPDAQNVALDPIPATPATAREAQGLGHASKGAAGGSAHAQYVLTDGEADAICHVDDVSDVRRAFDFGGPGLAGFGLAGFGLVSPHETTFANQNLAGFGLYSIGSDCSDSDPSSEEQWGQRSPATAGLTVCAAAPIASLDCIGHPHSARYNYEMHGNEVSDMERLFMAHHDLAAADTDLAAASLANLGPGLAGFGLRSCDLRVSIDVDDA
eukprot:CAMPEP_0117462630 /NCGR_PEP_ID=MMETSP0784-20121206/3154_1 /TAXON_ID=39447 /ORGANISM="" /LENGTH=483 /DNA_ID=CAMNT_0005256403 /DNA_START=1 /DNA_END=1452 /DNA_ORIENTATION=+